MRRTADRPEQCAERVEPVIRKTLTGGVSRYRQRTLLLCLLAALAVAASLSLAGCKYSDVLTQHTEDPNIGTLDEGVDPIYRANPDSDLEMDLANISLDDAEDQDTQVAMLPHYDPDAPDNGPTPQRKKNKETPHDEEASEGEESEEEADRDGTGTDDKAEQSRGDTDESDDEDEQDDGGDEEKDDDDDDNGDDNKNDENKNNDEEKDNDTLEDDESDESDQSTEGGNSGDTVVVDPDDGTNEDTEKGTVAAVGEYATIAQMLGGAGALAGCDESWLQARAADGCFAGELDRVEKAFSGDGTKEGSCDVDALIGTIKPSVVLWDSTANEPNLSDSDRAALAEAGINVQPVPHIGEQNTEDYGVELAVTAVASVLEGAAGLERDPAEELSAYCSMREQVLSGCLEANGGYSYKYCGTTTMDQLYQDSTIPALSGSESTTNRWITAYVDGMTSAGKSTLSVSRHASGGTADVLSLDASDGVGISAASASGYLVLDYYLQLAGVVNNAYDTAKPDSKGRSFIVMPGSASENIGSNNSYMSRSLDTGSALSYWTVDKDTDANWHELGDANFNTVLVANSDVQAALAASAKKSNGLYHVGKAYDIVVVPSGIEGSWAAGHVDSFLMTPWAFRLQSADNLAFAEDYVKFFYENFMHCSDWTGAIADWSTSVTVD